MTIFGWFLIGFWVMEMILSITRIGKPRKPLEPSTVAIMLVLSGVLIAAVLIVGTGTGV